MCWHNIVLSIMLFQQFFICEPIYWFDCFLIQYISYNNFLSIDKWWIPYLCASIIWYTRTRIRNYRILQSWSQSFNQFLLLTNIMVWNIPQHLHKVYMPFINLFHRNIYWDSFHFFLGKMPNVLIYCCLRI